MASEYPATGRMRQRVADLTASIGARYGFFTQDQAREAAIRSGAASLGETGLLALTYRGERVYPGFQFKDQMIRPEWRGLVTPLLEAGWEASEVLLWMASPSGWIPGGRVPADLLDTDLEAVKTAIDAVEHNSF